MDKWEVTGTETTEGIDGVSGATISLEKTAYILGAVWTCYSLWHWVNGGAREIIRNITGDNYSIVELRTFLNDKNSAYQLFALEQLDRVKDDDPKTVSLLIDALERAPGLLKPSLVYLEAAPAPLFHNAIEHLIGSHRKDFRLGGLKAIIDTNHKLPSTFYQNLVSGVSNFQSYEEVDALLLILDNKNAYSSDMSSPFLSLLEGENFLIGRTVYWFLSDKYLTTQQQEMMKVFYSRFKHKM